MTFQEIFIDEAATKLIKVPDYQRAYSWESKQIELFIGDLASLVNRGGYYFGHFIVENGPDAMELVDGQQRLTTVVLFLRVCQIENPHPNPQRLFELLNRFETVGYDQFALANIFDKSPVWLKSLERAEPKDHEIIQALNLDEKFFTYSQRRLALAMWHFHRAFEKGTLQVSLIPKYVEELSGALCSCHITEDKTVAVNIFEMHNTRGVPLKLIEVVKAKLMKAVYDEGGPDRDKSIQKVQAEFAIIQAFEERLHLKRFRGEMTLEGILRHHLRVVDDGNKTSRDEMDKPPRNASSDELIRYVSERSSAAYAVALSREFRKSVQIICETLPAWDELSDGDGREAEKLVGDVMILHRGLSCELFLLVCRRLESAEGLANGRVSKATLILWEKLLFTHDFHDKNHRLARDSRENFPKLFAEFGQTEESISSVIERYLVNGFREDKTRGELQKVVRDHFVNAKDWILNSAFNGWRNKWIYALYKYEISQGANLRPIMKETISLEHILPQSWDRKWLTEDGSQAEKPGVDQDHEKHLRELAIKIDSCINGLGNLLLVTREQNSSLSNEHPARKSYMDICQSGSYSEHEKNRDRANPDSWNSAAKWEPLIHARGEKIITFILENMLN